MQLKKIKLSGFKSFVDPTTVQVASNLVSVVGPNGCGKSNIIDAVCWVMGESSAKYLRGESLTDVIFNGSTARKPVGQASVELVFDNQDGSLEGEYASYAEISIRRQINRESAESTYYLNGTRCRRRDIIGIFLGTGLGPRSYSIIGQNMISRIVEAKPDDMRNYLEEAAGVSRYKERRRETENRMQHTKDNLARLNDVRVELDKQLSTLQRQANAAEKFKLLKQEERLVRGQLYGVQWRQLDNRLVNESLQIQQQATGLEARQTDLGELNLQIEYQREVEHQANEIFQEVQRRYYSIGNDITRLEQEIQHHEERIHQWKTDIQQVDNDWQTVKNEVETAQEQMQELTEEIIQLEPDAATANEAMQAALQEMEEIEEAMLDWQGQWDEFNQNTAKTAQNAQVEQTRIQHLEQKITSLTQQQAKLEQDKPQFDFDRFTHEIELLSEQIFEVDSQAEEYNQKIMDTRNQIQVLQTTQQQTTQKLDQIRNELQKARGQQASLEALQQTALGQRNNPIIEWLNQHELDKLPRLAQGIEVEAGWEYAVEKVLGAYLQAVCVDDLSEVASFVNELNQGSLCVFSKNPSATPQTTETQLLHKVKSPWPLDSLLANVYIAETEAAAFEMAKSLASHESVITPDGLWLGASWLKITRDESPEAGVFQREQELKQLAQSITELTLSHDEFEESLANCREQLKELENQRDDLQKAANQAHAQSAEVHAQQKMKQTQLAEQQKRAERFKLELEENNLQLDEANTELTKTRSVWQQAMSDLEQQAIQREQLNQKRETSRDRLQTARANLDDQREQAHQLEIRLQTSKSQQSAIKQTIVRLESQLTTLANRKQTLQNELDSAQPIENRRGDLSNLLSMRLIVDEDLSKARFSMESARQDSSDMEARKQDLETEVLHYRDRLEKLRVEWQGIKVKSESLIEQLTEAGLQLETILQDLPEEIDANEWQAKLENINLRITRLGAINLVAIEEYATCSERKQYLDKQCDDLQEGLTTLENAIAKIDKETRAKFKETFEIVNTRFQELFPIVFGGGKAYLELTGENLLDAGISVMACPPENETVPFTYYPVVKKR